jgi:PAS domain S-box-containing protein
MVAFDLRLLIVGSSVFLQLIAAFVAFRIIIKARQLRVGVFIITAITLMAFRRGISLVRLINGEKIVFDIFAESVALIISVLLVIGVIYIKRLILKLKQAESERREKDKALLENEEKFSKVFRQAPLLITLSDIETGRLIDVNDKYLEISGFARDEVIGRTVLELGWISEEPRSRMLQTLRERGRVSGMELSLCRKDGKTVVCLYSGETIMVDGQQRLLSMAQDITERKKAEEKLQKTSQTLSAIISYSPLAIICTDVETNVLIWNPAAEKIFGWKEEEALGRKNPIVRKANRKI